MHFILNLSLFSSKVRSIEQVNQFIGLNATRSWVKGDIFKDNRVREDTCWIYNSPEIEGYVFRDVFPKLFLPIENVLPQIKQLIEVENFSCMIYIIVKVKSGHTMPGIHLDNKMIQLLSDLRAEIGFDIYDYRK